MTYEQSQLSHWVERIARALNTSTADKLLIKRDDAKDLETLLRNLLEREEYAEI